MTTSSCTLSPSKLRAKFLAICEARSDAIQFSEKVPQGSAREPEVRCPDRSVLLRSVALDLHAEPIGRMLCHRSNMSSTTAGFVNCINRDEYRSLGLKRTDHGTGDHGGSVGRFFDALSDDYTSAIQRCFPRYREMLWAILEYLPSDLNVDSILELGSGTGNLSVLLAESFPDATIRFVDLSGESIDVCRRRLGEDSRFSYEQIDLRDLAYKRSTFDLVASSISLHHLTSTEKQTLFTACYEWLKPGAVLAFADQFAGGSSDIYSKHIENWKKISLDAGSTHEEWDMWMRHQADHDHHDTLASQMAWLADAGFSVVDCPWRYLLWTVIQARK